MGGTSTDVSHYAGRFEREYETQVAGVRLRAPMLSINTVAAGGGSVLHFDGSRYRVGPDSAGADPGPACYRNGGPLTLTDANVLLGRIQPAHFPHVFGPRGDQPLDERRQPRQVRRPQRRRSPGHRRPARPGAGRGRVHRDRRGQHGQRDQEDLRPARLRRHRVRAQRVRRRGRPARLRGGRRAGHVQGADPSAGRACCPPTASAWPTSWPCASRPSRRRSPADLISELPQIFEPARGRGPRRGAGGREGQGGQAGGGVPASRITAERRVHLRYEGTDTALVVPSGPLEQMTAAFEAEYTRRFSFLMPGKTILAEAVSVEVITGTAHEPLTPRPVRPAADDAEPTAGPDVHRRVLGRCGPPSAGRPAAPARPSTARPSSPSSWPPPWSSPAGRPR